MHETTKGSVLRERAIFSHGQSTVFQADHAGKLENAAQRGPGGIQKKCADCVTKYFRVFGGEKEASKKHKPTGGGGGRRNRQLRSRSHLG